MSPSTHPSTEELSAFIDRELSSAALDEVEKHLVGCPDCRGLIEAFSFMNAMGPVVEESLPGDAYWADLPDRILVRLASDSSDAPSVRAGGRSIWQRLWQPQGVWRYAMGTVATLVVVAGAWTVIHRQQSLTEPMGGGLAENSAVTSPESGSSSEPLVASNFPQTPSGVEPQGDSEELTPGLSPESFARRVITTLGGPNDLGTSLNIASADNTPRPLTSAGIGTQVDYSLPPLSLQSRAETQDLVSCGPGESWLERAYICAVKADEVGNSALARQGYRVVLQNTDPSSILNWESGYRLTYHKWRDRILASPPGPKRAQALADLSELASQSYSTWSSSGGADECQTAWCLNRAFSKLAVEMTSTTEQEQTECRVGELVRCIDAQ
jgi:hypothetical protein